MLTSLKHGSIPAGHSTSRSRARALPPSHVLALRSDTPRPGRPTPHAPGSNLGLASQQGLGTETLSLLQLYSHDDCWALTIGSG